MKTFNKTLIATALMAVSAGSSAAGFLLNETSVSGLGRAFAGEGAAADDAAVLARNPAAMALFDQTALSLAGTYIDPGVDMRGVSSPLGSDPSALNIDGAAPQAFVPAAYLIMPLNDKVAIGFAGYSNFGLGTDFGENYPAGTIAGSTDLLTMNLNTSVSYRVNDHLSLGLGLNAVYGDAELIRHFGETAPLINGMVDANLGPAAGLAPDLEPSSISGKMAGDGWGFGFNVGVLYEVNDDHRIALTYKSKTTIELEGHYTNDLAAGIATDSLVGVGGSQVDGTLDLDLPDILEFSGYHKVSDKVILHTTVMWTGWSVFEELRGVADGDTTLEGPLCANGNPACQISDGQTLLLKEENFEDAWRFGLGMTYLMSDAVTLRAGIAYDETPIPETHRTVSIPDSDRMWYSFGANYQLSDNSDVDLAFTFIDGKEVRVEEDGYVLNSEGNAFLVGAQYNYRF
ncbi:outer membrane protein transport protein [Ferrimonas sp. YFM]|uniref:outer membrane protein transport protein n=1 Tax=Ferrimonas sp. YFM TaxID=3028878 RepID=UPI002572C59D|nr:outer membrane protein transport protein [Ferrimonas sp. YFM]BDY06141.1 long-chain fatty acid outer membrane transporter [Ferrimonas sp. YFM]